MNRQKLRLQVFFSFFFSPSKDRRGLQEFFNASIRLEYETRALAYLNLELWSYEFHLATKNGKWELTKCVYLRHLVKSFINSFSSNFFFFLISGNGWIHSYMFQ